MCKVIDKQEMFDNFVEEWARQKKLSIAQVLEFSMVKEYAKYLDVQNYSKKY